MVYERLVQSLGRIYDRYRALLLRAGSLCYWPNMHVPTIQLIAPEIEMRQGRERAQLLRDRAYRNSCAKSGNTCVSF